MLQLAREVFWSEGSNGLLPKGAYRLSIEAQIPCKRLGSVFDAFVALGLNGPIQANTNNPISGRCPREEIILALSVIAFGRSAVYLSVYIYSPRTWY